MNVTALSAIIGKVDDQSTILVMSTNTGQTHLHALDATNARGFAEQLTLLADHLDPPAKQDSGE